MYRGGRIRLFRIDDCVVFMCKSKMHGLETISLIALLRCLLPSGAGNVGDEDSVSAVTRKARTVWSLEILSCLGSCEEYEMELSGEDADRIFWMLMLFAWLALAWRHQHFTFLRSSKSALR